MYFTHTHMLSLRGAPDEADAPCICGTHHPNNTADSILLAIIVSVLYIDVHVCHGCFETCACEGNTSTHTTHAIAWWCIVVFLYGNWYGRVDINLSKVFW
jgi:hypothetical protein